MKIQPAKDDSARPRTRRELLSHLWGIGLTSANVFREGPYYTLQAGRVLVATHLRCIDTWTFADWARETVAVAALARPQL